MWEAQDFHFRRRARWPGMARLILAAVLAFHGAPSVAQHPDRPSADALEIGVRKDLSTMNPQVNTDSFDMWLRELMYDWLLDVDLKGDLHPLLATAWEVSEDRMTYEFVIRKGVTFHNGAPLTAADVKYSMDYVRDPQNGAFGYTALKNISAVNVLDDHRVAVHLREPQASFLYDLASIRSFVVVPENSLEGLAATTGETQRFPPGTGPFSFVTWGPGQYITLSRFDGHWGHRADVVTLTLRITPDGNQRVNALRSAGLDVIENAPYPWVRRAQREPERFGLLEAPYGGFTRIIFNVRRGPFTDGKLRAAVTHALKREDILSAMDQGFGTPTNQFYPSNHRWYFQRHASVAGYDPDAAKALLNNGHAPTTPVTLLIYGEPRAQTGAAVIQAQLAAVGIKVDVLQLEPTAYFSRLRNGDFEFILYGGALYADPALTYGKDWKCEEGENRLYNISGYCVPEVDRALSEANTGRMQDSERQVAYETIFGKVMNTGGPEYYIGWSPRFHAYNADRVSYGGRSEQGDGSFRWVGGGFEFFSRK